MRFSLWLLSLFALLFLNGCEKVPVAGGAEKVAAPPAPSADFAREYEGWKTRAVQEFPDLGKAGTPMNTRFVAQAKQLSEQNAGEMKYPNWPYLLAVKINAELAASPKTGPVVGGLGRVYTIPDLKALSTLPGAAVVMGRVTKFDEIGMPPGVLLVVLDDTLKCEVTMYEIGPGDSLGWQRSGSSISLVRQAGKGGSAPSASLSMGQVLRVEGVFVQKRGTPVLVGTAKYQ
jgi:hypothetical protein